MVVRVVTARGGDRRAAARAGLKHICTVSSDHMVPADLSMAVAVGAAAGLCAACCCADRPKTASAHVICT